MKQTKVIITERALVQRLNRVLIKDGDCLKKAHSAYQASLGDYYWVDLDKNAIIEKDVDIVALGKSKGVIKPWETLAK